MLIQSTKSESVPLVSRGTSRMKRQRINTFYRPGLLLLIGTSLLLLSCSAGKETGNVHVGQTSDDILNNTLLSSASHLSRDQLLRQFVAGARAVMGSDCRKAIQWYKGILDEIPDHNPTLSALARCYESLGELDSAQIFALHALRMDTTDLESLKLLAGLLTTKGEFDSAAALYSRIVAIRPDDLQARFMIARTWDHRNPKEAIKHYEYIRDNITEDYLSLVNLYDMQLLERRPSQAARTLRLLIAHNPGDATLHELHCTAWTEAEEYDSAISALYLAELYLEDHDDLEQFLLNELQIVRIRLQGYIRDEDPFQRFVSSLVGIASRECSGTTCLYQASLASMGIGHEGLADSLLGMAIEAGPLSAASWVEAAGKYQERERYSDMLEVLGKAGKRYEDDPDVLFLTGKALLKSGDREKGRELLRKATTIDPDHAEAWYVLAKDDVEQGDVGSGMQAYEQAVYADPYNPVLLNAYARLLASEKMHLEKGEDLIDRALAIEPENELFLTTRGLLDYQKKDYRSAASYLQRAVDAGGATAERYELLGDTRMELGELREATAAWQRALDLSEDIEETKKRIRKKMSKSGL